MRFVQPQHNTIRVNGQGAHSLKTSQPDGKGHNKTKRLDLDVAQEDSHFGKENQVLLTAARFQVAPDNSPRCCSSLLNPAQCHGTAFSLEKLLKIRRVHT